jgi:hypothetical protein
VNDRIFLGLAVFILILFGADIALNGGSATMFLLRKLALLVDTVAFWRH